MTPTNVLEAADFNDQHIGHRVVLEDPIRRVLLVSLRKGQILPENAAEGLLTIYCASGEVELKHRSGKSTLKAGDLVGLVPGERHSLQAGEDTRLLVSLVHPAPEALWNSLAPNGRDLDLRSVPHAQRHSTVFYAFDNLAVGEKFFIINDHDPQPLRFQIEQARPGEMSWEYALRGPEHFRIAITRVAAPARA